MPSGTMPGERQGGTAPAAQPPGTGGGTSVRAGGGYPPGPGAGPLRISRQVWPGSPAPESRPQGGGRFGAGLPLDAGCWSPGIHSGPAVALEKTLGSDKRAERAEQKGRKN